MSKEFSVEQMQMLMQCINENKIGEFLYETEGVRLRIRGAQLAAAPGAAPAVTTAATAVAAVAAAQPATPEATPEEDGAYVTSPIVGTFYAASGPDKEPFVKVGQPVQKGDIVFIVESMKVMNEVPADQSGTVAEILVQDGDAVEYGQPILRLK